MFWALKVRRRNLPLQQLIWSGVMSISSVIRIVLFIRQVIGSSKNSMELLFNAKFDFKSTWNRDSITSHHKHPVCQSLAAEAEKLTNVWSRYFGTNRIIDNWHRCLGVMWRKRKKYFEKLFLKQSMDCQFSFHWPTKLFTYYEDFS